MNLCNIRAKSLDCHAQSARAKRSNVVTGLQAGVFWFGRGMHPSQTRAIETPAFRPG